VVRRIGRPGDADLRLVEFHLAKLGAESDLGGVPANADADDPFRRSHPRRIEYVPTES
jgi:hypothetical protein